MAKSSEGSPRPKQENHGKQSLRRESGGMEDSKDKMGGAPSTSTTTAKTYTALAVAMLEICSQPTEEDMKPW